MFEHKKVEILYIVKISGFKFIFKWIYQIKQTFEDVEDNQFISIAKHF